MYNRCIIDTLYLVYPVNSSAISANILAIAQWMLHKFYAISNEYEYQASIKCSLFVCACEFNFDILRRWLPSVMQSNL